MHGGVTTPLPRRSAGRPPEDRHHTPETLTEDLRRLRAEAGQPSYAEIARRIGTLRRAAGTPGGRPARSTVYDVFRPGRRRLDADLVAEIASALGADDAAAASWADASRAGQLLAETADVVTVRSDLPEPVRPFVGREPELRAIGDASGPESAPVVVISGLPGSGKTQLALRAAELLCAWAAFDVVLYADLRGFDADVPPANPGAVLEGFLRLLGVPAAAVPRSEERRPAALADELEGRRALVLLDDASDVEQVRPLCRPRPGTVTIVTSRRRLDGLDATVPLALQELNRDDGVQLLSEVSGSTMPDEAAESAAALIEATGRLPLAITLAARRVAARPEWSLDDHRDVVLERRRHLQLDDAFRVGLDTSYDALGSPSRSLLRLLAGQPCTDLDLDGLAALAGEPRTRVAASVDELAGLHLVTSPGDGRYGLHDVVRAYARDRSVDEDRPRDHDDALRRLCEHHLRLSWSAYRVLPAASSLHRTPAGVDAEGFEAEEEARRWLALNVDNLLVMAAAAAELGDGELVLQFSASLADWLNAMGRSSDAAQLHRRAVEVAVAVGDESAEGRARLDVGRTMEQMGRDPRGAAYLREAVEILERTGDQWHAIRAVNSLAVFDMADGRLDDAAVGLRRVVQLARELDAGAIEARAWSNLAVLDGNAGRPEEAVGHLRRAIELAERDGDDQGRATFLINLGETHRVLGQHGPALDRVRDGIAVAERVDYRRATGYGFDTLGTLMMETGRSDEALQHFEEALQCSRDVGDRQLESGVLAHLGAARVRTGQLAAARDVLTLAADIARDQHVRAQVDDAFRELAAQLDDPPSG